MGKGWVVMVQKANPNGGFEAPKILGSKVLTSYREALETAGSVKAIGGLDRAHAYLVEVEIV